MLLPLWHFWTVNWTLRERKWKMKVRCFFVVADVPDSLFHRRELPGLHSKDFPIRQLWGRTQLQNATAYRTPLLSERRGIHVCFNTHGRGGCESCLRQNFDWFRGYNFCAISEDLWYYQEKKHNLVIKRPRFFFHSFVIAITLFSPTSVWWVQYLSGEWSRGAELQRHSSKIPQETIQWWKDTLLSGLGEQSEVSK